MSREAQLAALAYRWQETHVGGAHRSYEWIECLRCDGTGNEAQVCGCRGSMCACVNMDRCEDCDGKGGWRPCEEITLH